MNKYIKFLIFFLILLSIGSGYYFITNKTTLTPSPTPTAVVVQALKTNLSIDDSGGRQSFDISGFIGKTALEASASVAKIETNGSGENAFITSVNGIAADTKKHEFWELVVNGQSAQVGAGSYIIQKGDSILWKLSTY